ncbi:serine hydrolase domain-containing protein [uncultured Herbaspirillum sp.]|uniref:serine hydrolase domain-containing protein n=1 Tax=uncultured Herbaspirillum sp. TaxID=160236 RepID=UPI0025853ACF|nr:serine hydrolase domain-containing protein [uncultured Herbaspirillum sp.]
MNETKDNREKKSWPNSLPRKWAFLWGAVGIVCAACTSARGGAIAPSEPSEVRESPVLHSATQHSPIDENWKQIALRYGICNVSVAVLRRRELQSIELTPGCTPDSATTPDSVFEAASLSKPLFAYAVLKLVEQGKMELDTPIMTYLPNGYQHRSKVYLPDSSSDQVSDPRLKAVTVRMALNHTTGLPNWSSGALFFNNSPGEKWEYSGEGYVLLQRAVEAITQQNLSQFMEQQIFKPLGMKHSAYAIKPEIERFIVGGLHNDGTPRPAFPFRVPVAAFTLYTNAHDYGLFLSALLKDQAILEQIAASPIPVSQKLNLSWGLGWGLEENKENVFLWHWGNNPGYRSFVMVSPATGDGFVMFSNSDKGLAIAEPLGKMIFPGQHRLFRFHLLRDGLSNLMCETFDICFSL